MEFKQDQERSIDLAESVIRSTEVVHSDFNTCFNALTTLLAQTLTAHSDLDFETFDGVASSLNRTSNSTEHNRSSTDVRSSFIGLRASRYAITNASDFMPLLTAHVIDSGLGLYAGVGQMSLHSARTKLKSSLSRIKSGSTDSLLIDSSRSSNASHTETNQEILYSAIDSSFGAFKDRLTNRGECCSVCLEATACSLWQSAHCSGDCSQFRAESSFQISSDPRSSGSASGSGSSRTQPPPPSLAPLDGASSMASTSELLSSVRASPTSAAGWPFVTQVVQHSADKLDQVLRFQGYVCWNCKSTFSIEQRGNLSFCNYSGAYYCQLCFSEKLSSCIPSRVLRLCDSRPYPVSDSSFKQIATLLVIPLFSLDNLNLDFGGAVREKCKAFERLHELRVQLFFLIPYVFTCARLLNAPELSVCFEKASSGGSGSGASVTGSASAASSSAASRAAELAHTEALYSSLLSGSVPLPPSVPARGALSAVHAILTLFAAFPRHWRLQHLHNARKLLLALGARELQSGVAHQQSSLAADAFGPLSLPPRASSRPREGTWPGDGPQSLIATNGAEKRLPDSRRTASLPVRTSRTVADSYLTYSLNDILICLSPNGRAVLNQLQRVVQILREHVTRDCCLCSLLGFYCEFCSTLSSATRSFSVSVSLSVPSHNVPLATASTRSASNLTAIPNASSKDADTRDASPTAPASAPEPPAPRANADSVSSTSIASAVSSPPSPSPPASSSNASKQQQQQRVAASQRENPLFPFDCERVAQCFDCHACFHSDCLVQLAANEEPECPKCARLRARRVTEHSSTFLAAGSTALRSLNESNAQV